MSMNIKKIETYDLAYRTHNVDQFLIQTKRNNPCASTPWFNSDGQTIFELMALLLGFEILSFYRTISDIMSHLATILLIN